MGADEILDWLRSAYPTLSDSALVSAVERAERAEAEVRQLREENENLRIEYTQLCDMYEKDFDKKIDSAPRGAKETD